MCGGQSSKTSFKQRQELQSLSDEFFFSMSFSFLLVFSFFFSMSLQAQRAIAGVRCLQRAWQRGVGGESCSSRPHRRPLFFLLLRAPCALLYLFFFKPQKQFEETAKRKTEERGRERGGAICRYSSMRTHVGVVWTQT